MFSLWYVFALRVKCRLPIRQRERELGRECRFSARRRQSPVVRGNPGDRLAQGNGRGSHTVTQVWFGIAVAAALTESPFWYSARLHSPDSRFTRESPRFSKIAHVDRHLAAEQRRARMTLELLNCRQPGACLPVRQMQIPRCGRGCARRLRW